MKKIASILSFFSILMYWSMHVYFAYTAFTAFSTWFALVTTLVPVGGDMLFIGACIAEGIWTPAILFAVVGIAYSLSHVLSSRYE